MTAHRSVGVGVVGCGYWGPKIIRNLADLDGADLIAVCDMSEERLRPIGQRYPAVNTTTDFRSLLTDPAIEAIVIATPIRTHFKLAMAALLHGKHVLVEKPLTADVTECDQLVEAAEIGGRVLMVGHTFQYNPAVERLRELVAAGELGEIFYVDCARLNLGLFQRDINVLWDLAPHDISILMHVLGAAPEKISTHGAAHVLADVDDLALLNLRFPGGINAHIRLSWLDPCKVRRVTVVGNRRMAVFDDTAEERLRVFDRRVALRFEEGFNGPVFDYHDGEVEIPVLDTVEPLRAQLAHFLACIANGGCPTSDGRMGREVVRVLEAADRSRREDGRWVMLPPADVPWVAAPHSRAGAAGDGLTSPAGTPSPEARAALTLNPAVAPRAG